MEYTGSTSLVATKPLLPLQAADTKNVGWTASLSTTMPVRRFYREWRDLTSSETYLRSSQSRRDWILCVFAAFWMWNFFMNDLHVLSRHHFVAYMLLFSGTLVAGRKTHGTSLKIAVCVVCILVGVQVLALWLAMDSSHHTVAVMLTTASALPLYNLCGIQTAATIPIWLSLYLSVGWRMSIPWYEMLVVAAIGVGIPVFSEKYVAEAIMTGATNNYLLEQGSHGYCSIDRSTGTISEASDAFAKWFGESSMEGKSLSSFVSDNDQHQLKQCLVGMELHPIIVTCTVAHRNSVCCRMVPYYKTAQVVKICVQRGGVPQNYDHQSAFSECHDTSLPVSMIQGPTWKDILESRKTKPQITHAVCKADAPPKTVTPTHIIEQLFVHAECQTDCQAIAPYTIRLFQPAMTGQSKPAAAPSCLKSGQVDRMAMPGQTQCKAKICPNTMHAGKAECLATDPRMLTRQEQVTAKLCPAAVHSAQEKKALTQLRQRPPLPTGQQQGTASKLRQTSRSPTRDAGGQSHTPAPQHAAVQTHVRNSLTERPPRPPSPPRPQSAKPKDVGIQTEYPNMASTQDAAVQTEFKSLPSTRPPRPPSAAPLPRPAKSPSDDNSHTDSGEDQKRITVSRRRERHKSRTKDRGKQVPVLLDPTVPPCIAQFSRTIETTVKLILYHAMEHINPAGQACCAWHLVLAITHSAIRELALEKCRPDYRPQRDWQCQQCFAVHEITEDAGGPDLPQRVCYVCCTEDRPQPEAT